MLLVLYISLYLSEMRKNEIELNPLFLYFFQQLVLHLRDLWSLVLTGSPVNEVSPLWIHIKKCLYMKHDQDNADSASIFLVKHLIIHNDQVGQRCQGGQNGKDDLLVIWSNVVWSSVPFKVTSRNVYMKLAFDH